MAFGSDHPVALPSYRAEEERLDLADPYQREDRDATWEEARTVGDGACSRVDGRGQRGTDKKDRVGSL